jgi:hypothetical protein
MPDLVLAVYQGPFNPGELVDGEICVGETYLVTEEDVQSSWWSRVDEQPEPEPVVTAPAPAPAWSDPLDAEESDG